MKSIPIKKGGRSKLKDGLYRAQIVATEVYSKNFEWGEGKGIKLYFKLFDYPDERVTGLFWLQKDSDGYYLSEDSTGASWVRAILGSVKDFKRSDLEGKECIVFIKMKDQWPTVEDILPKEKMVEKEEEDFDLESTEEKEVSEDEL